MQRLFSLAIAVIAVLMPVAALATLAARAEATIEIAAGPDAIAAWNV